MAKKVDKNRLNIVKRPFNSLSSFFSRLTMPVRKTGAWRWLRRYILRSPFNGYFVDSFRELKKVTWPDRKTAWKLTLVVIVFSVVFSAFTTLLDVGFERLAKLIFLN